MVSVLDGQSIALPALVPEGMARISLERSVGGIVDFDRRSAEAAPKNVSINPPDDSHDYRFFVGTYTS